MTAPVSHRVSFRSENASELPPSPRIMRQPSISSVSLRDNPPVGATPDPKFAERDWRSIQIGELIEDTAHFVELDTDIETATKALTAHKFQALLVCEKPGDETAIGTFDYNDLNTFLLFNIGILTPNEDQVEIFQELGNKVRSRNKVSLRDLAVLGKKEPYVTIPHTASLPKAIETFGGGVHRVVAVREGTEKVVGVLSQFRLVKFLWENRRCFPDLDKLYPMTLGQLGVGSQTIIAINGDKPLQEALKLMHDEGVTSVAVLDNQLNVIGNISVVDVKHLTKASSLPTLTNTCINFCRIILSERGLEHGRDSFPVFHVNFYSTLAHTVAKLIATISHRMWITDSSSPSSSTPPTPVHQTVILSPSFSNIPTSPPPPPSPPFSAASPTASSMPGTSGAISGRLTGVISLTDILNLFARASGLKPTDPAETRRSRRRSSSTSVRPSLDLGRPERPVFP